MTGVVLIHGYLESPKMWDFVLPEISAPAVLLTLPGHGPEGLPAVSDMAELAAEAWKKIDGAGLTRVHFIGHSMGGYLALACARLRPANVGSVCLFHSTARADSEEKKARRDKAIGMLDVQPEVYLRATIAGLFANPNLSAESINQQILMAEKIHPADLQTCLRIMKGRADNIHFLCDRDFRLGFISGNQDPLLPVSETETEITAVKPDFFWVIENAGHMSHRENQTAAKKALSAWIAENPC